MIFRSAPSLCLFFCAAVAALSTTAAVAQPANAPSAQPFAQSERIPDRYIVVFKAGVADPAAEAANVMRGAGGGQILHTYTAAIKGFAAALPAAALQAIRSNPNVEYVEQDQTVSLSDMQTQATWGLDRIDQRDRALDFTYHYGNTGLGVSAFIIDTGIRADHVEFGGRLREGYSSISDGNGTNDCNGHGTHVAGTVGGTTWGVAKQVALTPVRVLNCRGSGSWSGVIAGIDWVVLNKTLPAVANMSLGGGLSSAVNQAVANAVAAGVTMVVAAGNSNANACNYSPASEPSAITVGATASTDARASYSNFGPCVDIFAPGSGITSAWNTTSDATNTISGTSMASPHVAGAAALVAQSNPAASPAAIALFLTVQGTPGVVTSEGTGSPKLLLYSMGTGAATEPPTQLIAIKEITPTPSLNLAGAKVKSWQAKAIVTVHNVETKAAVANATVRGSFDPGNTASCVTASNGSCTLASGNLSLATPITVLSVTGASGTLMSYDPNSNLPVQVTIHKP